MITGLIMVAALIVVGAYGIIKYGKLGVYGCGVALIVGAAIEWYLRTAANDSWLNNTMNWIVGVP